MFFTLRINYLLAKIMKHDMSMFVDGFGIQEKNFLPSSHHHKISCLYIIWAKTDLT